ncbi:ZPBP2 protein, partial [Halcyon senegalensis]|nr:ZPBP2 protein [Halcyon senegalensis]
VNVYVKVFTNSPFLVCTDLAHSQEEIIDPEYSWIGPDGKKLEGQKHVKLTETGRLMVMGFKESMSGAYTCTLSHSVLETVAQGGREMVETYKFMVYAYREADHEHRVLARFTTEERKLAANSHFFEEILNNIISALTCHIVESSYKCHSIQTPNQGLLHELFVSFQVNPFAPGWEEVCHQVPRDCEDVTNRRAQEARALIGQFFSEQTYYIENSFSVAHVEGCRPGFGKNDIKHESCTTCCVVCEPGTYSPDNSLSCQICTRPRVKEYGARSCK